MQLKKLSRYVNWMRQIKINGNLRNYFLQFYVIAMAERRDR